ncbi:c-type cytochrome [Sinorhizobium sp. BG8]|uniref:c-type cytochrome n=1 Tax=Sinorhizobium sp. BG8 TaxID=2613773 RepID=UPI00193E74B1|nr:c-type cytochrome [Sinorhizobium sp. BG8]QRM55459.1 c-type cytochrome [Sinorhizobium sp. BG8]
MPMPRQLSDAVLRATRPCLRLAAAAGIVLSVLCPAGAVARDHFSADAFSGYVPDKANGKDMFAAAGCGACHGSGDNTELLSGGMEMETAIGKFFAPNISAHPNGTGGWSNGDFLNAVMNGVDRDGNHLYPVMPYTSYGGMKPEDVLDIKAYIDTLPPSDAVSREHEIAFPFNRQTTLTLWKRTHFTVPSYQAREQTQQERGRYLVENVGACGDCHTPRTTTYGLDTEHAYEGEKGLTGAVAPDITKARIAGLASPELFTVGVIEESKKLSGTPLSDPLMRRIAKGMSALGEEDRLAIYSFLADRPTAVRKPDVEPVCKEKTAQAALGGDNGALASAADAFIGKYCRNCHGPGEGSQGSFPAGDLASIAANAAFVTPGDAGKSRLFTSVTSGRMPLGKRPDVSEVKALEEWIDSLDEKALPDTAASPPTRTRPMLGYKAFIEAALKDISGVSDTDKPFMRYFSYRNQYNGMMGCEDQKTFMKRMDVLAGGFKKLLNSVSFGPDVVVPTEVEGTDGLLVRVDIRDLAWDTEDYDFLIGEYVYGVDPESDPSLNALSKATDTTLPIMRVDWFMSNGARPKVYNRLMKLPTDIRELEKRFDIDVDNNIRTHKIVRAGFTDGSSGVSDHNRMLERHDMPFGGYYWKSYDFGGDVGKQVLKRFPHGPATLEPLETGLEAFHHDGGEMIFSLPNGLQGYYLSTAAGKQLDVGPTNIVSFRQRPIGKGVEITNARSCFDCHANGILSKRDQLREHIETSTLFSKDQQEALLAMYVPQETLDRVYDQDRKRFVAALQKLDVTEPTPDGGAQSILAPGNAELVTYFADKYEEELNFEAVAAEFDMTPGQFSDAVRRLTDLDVLRLGIDWVATLEAGGTIPRVEIEQQFPFLLEPLMRLRPLQRSADALANASSETSTGIATTGASAIQTVAETPAYRQDDKTNEGKLRLALHVPSTVARVGDQLSFELTTNKACELQVMYVEETGNVEIIPDVMIGDPTLKPDEKRLIPQPGTGDLTFDTPSAAETMIAFCRVGGLGGDRLSADRAKDLVAEARQPVTRGLAINLAKKAEEDKGASGVQMVTFEIKDK